MTLDPLDGTWHQNADTNGAVNEDDWQHEDSDESGYRDQHARCRQQVRQQDRQRDQTEPGEPTASGNVGEVRIGVWWVRHGDALQVFIWTMTP